MAALGTPLPGIAVLRLATPTISSSSATVFLLCAVSSSNRTTSPRRSRANYSHCELLSRSLRASCFNGMRFLLRKIASLTLPAQASVLVPKTQIFSGNTTPPKLGYRVRNSGQDLFVRASVFENCLYTKSAFIPEALKRGTSADTKLKNCLGGQKKAELVKDIDEAQQE